MLATQPAEEVTAEDPTPHNLVPFLLEITLHSGKVFYLAQICACVIMFLLVREQQAA
jgi:hypothetical protein